MTAKVTVRGGDTVTGQPMVFDLSNSDAAVDSNEPGSPSSGLRNVRVPASGDVNIGIVAITEKAVLDDKSDFLVTSGPCRCRVQKNSGNIAVGDPLYLSATNNYLDADSPGVAAKVVAIANQAVTGPSTATLANVIVGDFGHAAS
jgi:hypothetical protein